MSNWSKFRKREDTECGVTTSHLTMNLRQVIRKDGSTSIEQLIEHRNEQGMVVNTEWVAIPVIMET